MGVCCSDGAFSTINIIKSPVDRLGAIVFCDAMCVFVCIIDLWPR